MQLFGVFQNKKNRQAEKFDLSMGGVQLKRDKTPKFLGVTFDEYLNAKEHMNHLRIACSKRLNVIKLLAHKSWSLAPSTLVNIYRALVLSKMEYSYFLYDTMPFTFQRQLQTIQNSALRAIFHKNREFCVSELHSLAGLQKIDDRMECLTNNYIETADSNNNPLIQQLLMDYSELSKE